MSEQSTIVQSVARVIGLDTHPDSFTACIVRGPTPAAAIIEKVCNKVPLGRLRTWATQNSTADDLFVLEVLRRLAHELDSMTGNPDDCTRDVVSVTAAAVRFRTPGPSTAR